MVNNASDAIVDSPRDASDLDTPDAIVDAAPPDAEVEQTCANLGGVCTAALSTVCAPGTKPYGADDGLECTGHCCVPDAESSCDDEATTNCLSGDACSGCWAPAEQTFECTNGRHCCRWDC